MAATVTKNQKKNMKRNQKAKAAKIQAQPAKIEIQPLKFESQLPDVLLQLEVRKMLFPSLELATTKAHHSQGALYFEARKMLFPSWELGNSQLHSGASVPAFVTSPNSIPVMAGPRLVTSESISDDEASLNSSKNSTGSNSPSSQSSVSVEDIENVIALLKVPKVEASEPRQPSLRRRFTEAQRQRALNPNPWVLVPHQDVPYLYIAPNSTARYYAFNATMLPSFEDMRLTTLNSGGSGVSRSVMEPPVVFTPPHENRHGENSAYDTVSSEPIPVMTKCPVLIEPSPAKAPVVSAPKSVIDEPAREPEIFEETRAPLAPIDLTFSDTESEGEEFQLFGSPLTEIDSSFSESEDDGYFNVIAPAIVTKKTKKVKVQAMSCTSADNHVSVSTAASVDGELLVSEPTLFETFDAEACLEVDMEVINSLSLKCAIGGSLFLVGCAGIGALVVKMLSRK